MSSTSTATTSRGKVYNNKNKNGRFRSQNHVFRKRQPPKPVKDDTDVYVTSKSDFKSQLERLEKLWFEDRKEIIIRGLGAAIPRTVNLALQFRESHSNTFDFDVTTYTVEVKDDLEPITDECDFETQSRNLSAIKICIKRHPDFPAASP